MSVGWANLPILPLRCILEHLSVNDALAATSTCQHWRSAILLYEGHKDVIKLSVKNIEKSMFLTRIFKKYTKHLHIYIDTTVVEELVSFMNYILPLYFDTVNLNELAFLGPSYILKNPNVPIPQLQRIIVETLVFKNLHSLQRLLLTGCEMATPKNENDRYVHKNVEYYSRPLTFSTKRCLDDTILSRSNVGLMMFSKLQSIVIDYEYLSSAAVNTLSRLPELALLTLNIGHKRPLSLPRFEWPPETLNVAINVIAVPLHRFNDIIEHVFVRGLLLVSLKVMFCKTFHVPLLSHLSRLYKSTLQEFVWVDAPCISTTPFYRVVKPEPYDVCVNHILLMCWQCVQLRRLVIHGYWLWQYDVLGIVRLRRSLERLELSAVYGQQNHFGTADNRVLRVLANDDLDILEAQYIEKINEHTQFKWAPTTYEALPPALKLNATSKDRADYYMRETSL
ncbi:uncharacterized protein LOC111001928 [Pieris rapae]|uniref:uncharacterized protein LOC111001928 n=1 Tax=Pieris rapae TaxID=64459 RepID=UPI001E27E4AC|nr:uncharacterized protein LOC111001928 [Pieris rapae]